MDEPRRASLLLLLAHGGVPWSRPPPPPALLLGGARADLLAAGLREAVVQRLLELRAAGEPEREAERAARGGVGLLFPGDEFFPAGLEDHPLCPPLLYWRGLPVPPCPRVAIVGARSASRAMERFARLLGEAAARAGVPVVSGLARGIDAAAHAGCLDGAGFPVAVLGCGVDRVYPACTRALHAQVAARGALVSTYPLGTPPQPFHFPLRNRIVAALAARVVVVQATEDSGSMSTARAALDGGSDVCAVPGSPDDPLARGTNRLIRDGAHPILEPADLLDPLVGVGRVAAEAPRAARPARLDADARIRLQIGSTPLAAEEIAAAAHLPLAEVVERLLRLELEGKVERLPGRLYRNRA